MGITSQNIDIHSDDIVSQAGDNRKIMLIYLAICVLSGFIQSI
ncbi:hypothetical protein AB47_4554 [Escherichia coli 3-373-03_S1_C2]|nr:hypothetical protein AB47_4554 [Escherichia coli 3-373-03_S1_C2]